MTYLQAIDKLYSNPLSKNSRGVDLPCVIKRKGWESGKVMLLAKNQPRIAFAPMNPTTGKHGNPELTQELTNIVDLGSKDWEYFASKDFF